MNEIEQTRQVFFDLLTLLASKEEQARYQTEVPIANVPAELMCQWFNDHYHPEAEWFQEAFTGQERAILKEFNDYYAGRAKDLPDTLPDLLQDPSWSEVVEKAAEALKTIDWGTIEPGHEGGRG